MIKSSSDVGCTTMEAFVWKDNERMKLLENGEKYSHKLEKKI